MIIQSTEATKHIGKEVTIRGWIASKRSSGKIDFLQIRDGGGLIQAIVSSEDCSQEFYKEISKCHIESAVKLKGVISEYIHKGKTKYEIQISGGIVFHSKEEYPISRKEHGPDFLLEKRHLWIRSQRQAAILRIRSSPEFAATQFLESEGFFRFDSPILTPSACEGTTDLFSVNYFDDEAYLSQSGQLYSEAGIGALEKVYTLGPCFRAEKSKTRRHLTEFWGVEPEVAWMTAEENMTLQERFIRFILKEVAEKRKTDLEILGQSPEKLLFSEKQFEVIQYTDAVKILQKKGFGIKWGEDLGVEEEAALSMDFDAPFFIYKYPVACRAFYIESDPQNSSLALSSDCLMPGGFGEIITGGQRASDYTFLKQRIIEHGLSMKDFEWYLDLRKFGGVPHSGFGMGIERMLRWIGDIHHIRETIPFPRTIKRFKP